MEIRKLRHASILAIELSFSKAAEKLNLSQSALSKSISSLENDLGIILFERHPSGVLLTPSGKEFIHGANRLLQQASALRYDMSLLKEGHSGNIIFGMGSFPAAAYEEQVILEIMKNHPEICAQVKVSTPTDLLDDLMNQRIEFFFGDTRTLHISHEYTVEHILKLKIGFFVRKNHPLLKFKKVSLLKVYDFPLLGAPISSEQLDNVHLDQWLGINNNRDFHMHVSSENISALKSVVSKTNAVIISPHGAVANELKSGKLVQLEVKEKQDKSYINFDLVKSARRQQSASAQVLTNLIIKIAKDVEKIE